MANTQARLSRLCKAIRASVCKATITKASLYSRSYVNANANIDNIIAKRIQKRVLKLPKTSVTKL